MSSKNRGLSKIMTADGNSIKQTVDVDIVDHKTYSYTGTLAVATGDRRLYMTRSGTFGQFDMYVKTAPTGAALNIAVKKNGSSVGTGTIADGASSGTSQSLSTASFASGDYITVDITQVGSTVAGEDLYINFRIAS